MATVKTDNASLPSKVAIRRWLLARLGITEVRVLDTCAGLGKIWEAMAEHVTVRQWTRCDVKPRRAGTLAMEALQAVQRFPLDAYNVIDIDPYGEPWEPYRAVLQRFSQPVAVFLTHGHKQYSTASHANLEAVGIPKEWPVPRTPELVMWVADHCLAQTRRYAEVTAAARIALPRVTYYALGLSPLCQACKGTRSLIVDGQLVDCVCLSSTGSTAQKLAS